MRRLTATEVRELADLFLYGNLMYPVRMSVAALTFQIDDMGEQYYEDEWQMQARLMAGPTGDDALTVNDQPGWLRLMVGQWSDSPHNEQIVLSSNRKELNQRFAQVNLNLSLTDGQTVFLVKTITMEGGPGAIKRLYRGASGPEMTGERAARKRQLAAALDNEPVYFEDEDWLVVAVLPLHIPQHRRNEYFTEAMVSILRYAAQVERLRSGVDPDDEEGRGGRGAPRRLSYAERKLIELAAMTRVRAHLEERGFELTDVSGRESYDFLARNGGQVRYIEVKGTTSRPWSVELTAPEHRLASRESARYSLFVVLFAGLDRLEEFELFEMGNPVTGDRCLVSPVRYRVQAR